MKATVVAMGAACIIAVFAAICGLAQGTDQRARNPPRFSGNASSYYTWRVEHDAQEHVTCWMSGPSISCLRDCAFDIACGNRADGGE